MRFELSIFINLQSISIIKPLTCPSIFPLSSLSEIQAEDLKSAALVLLNRLVDHQYALFVSSSKESDLLSLLIRLNKSSTKSKLIQKGCDTILDAWSSRSNPILGFGRMVDCLKDGLESLPRLDSKVEERERKELESQRVRVFTLGLRGLGNLLSRLPMELVEEELPRASDLIRTVSCAFTNLSLLVLLRWRLNYSLWFLLSLLTTLDSFIRLSTTRMQI